MPRKALSVANRLGDEFRFIRTWVANPQGIGAVSPSSRALARLMVRNARPDPAGWTLELGPGTGVVTQALVDAGIPPERIVSIEHNGDFCRLLRGRFPTMQIVQGDAFDLDGALADFGDVRFSAALSGLPLLSFPKERRRACVESVLDRLVRGGSMVQFSYGLGGPLAPVPGRIAVARSKWVVLNLPPARAWSYSRP